MTEIIEISKEHYEALLKQNSKLLQEVNELKEAQKETEWVDSKEAAQILHVTTRTLTNYRDRGYIPFTDRRAKYLYKKEDILNFLEKSYKKLPSIDDHYDDL